MLPKHFHGIHCSYKLFMVAFLTSHLPTHPHPVLSVLCQGTNMTSYVQPTSCRSEQARLRRDAMCVEWVCGILHHGDVAKWQMRMECSVSNPQTGQGAAFKTCPLWLFEIGSYGFCIPNTHISWDSAIKATLCGPNIHKDRPFHSSLLGATVDTCY